MKKVARVLSLILAVTILVGVGWYFFPAEQVKTGAKSIGSSIHSIWSKLDEGVIHAKAVKASVSSGDFGDKGEGLQFSSTYCPYRAMLSVKEQGVYNQIYANAKNSKGTFRLVCGLSLDELNETYLAILCDHPELFWLDNRYEYGYAAGDKNTAIQLTLEYNALVKNLPSAKADFDAAADRLISGASAYESDLDKERYVFESIAKSVEYNENAAYDQTSYSALVGHSTVCAGYARSFQYVLNKLGIPCYYIYGTAKGGYHAWNLVQIDGKWYNVDLTWCDQNSGIDYAYFNIPDSTISANHTRSEKSADLPAAVSPAKTGKKDSPTQTETKATAATSGQGILASVDDYNSACYSYLVSRGTGHYSFTVTLSGKELYDEILSGASRKDFESGYLLSAVSQLGLGEYSYDYNIAGDLDEVTGLVLLTQTVDLKEK